MDEKPEVIQQQMEETRSALVGKLEALEGQVAETVQSTSDAVQHTGAAVSDTVDTVKETVENVSESVQQTMESVSESVQQTMETVTETFQQTVHSVSELFDLRLQAQRHPWIVVGGAVAAGYVGYSVFDRISGRPSRAARSEFAGASSPALAAAPSPAAAPARSAPGMDWLWEEVGRLRGLAVGSLMSVIRDVARQAIPGVLGQRLADEVEVINKKVGGETIAGSLISPDDDNGSHNGGAGRKERVGEAT
jgi:hypothetical protein